MRRTIAMVVLALAACSRGVTVRTAPTAATEVSIKVSNLASQSVSVYVQSGGAELFLKQVAANATEVIPVPGVSAGSSVKLRATLADGSRSFVRESVVLTGVYEWKVP